MCAITEFNNTRPWSQFQPYPTILWTTFGDGELSEETIKKDLGMLSKKQHFSLICKCYAYMWRLPSTKKDLGMRRKDQDCGLLDANVTFQVLGIEGTDPWGVCTNGEITEGSWSSNNLSHQSGCLEILKYYEDPSNMSCNVWSLISTVPCETFFCRTLTWSVTSLERSFSSSLLQSFVTFQVTPDLCIGKILATAILEKNSGKNTSVQGATSLDQKKQGQLWRRCSA